MKRGFLAALALLLVPLASAQPTRNVIPDWPADEPRPPQLYVPLHTNPNPDLPLPQDALLPPTLPSILANREDMQLALVAIDLGLGDQNPYWAMSSTALNVFLNKLAQWDEEPQPADAIWPKVPEPDPRYQGVVVLLQTQFGKRFAPIRVWRGMLRGPGDEVLARDTGRRLEYWLFGTARVRRDQMLGSRVLPVFTFEQCRTLGQRIIETTPRQCLLANNNLLLETGEPPSLASARLNTFAECLHSGVGLIYTFPRRCVAAGGRVFTEPPQVFDDPLPADAPRRTPATTRLAPNAAKPIQVTPTSLLPTDPLLRPSPTAPRNASPTSLPWARLGG